MKIISQFKDYFDYLVYQYGVDEKLVLDRRGIGKFATEYNNSAVGSYTGMTISHNDVSNDPMPRSGRYYEERLTNRIDEVETNVWLVVNGRGYPLLRTEVYPNKYVLADDTNTTISKRFWMRVPKNVAGTELNVFKALSMACKRHVFIAWAFNRSEHWEIDGNVPNLGELKFAKILDAQAMYLQTVDFISENFVDKGEEIAVQSSLQKIESHGFDKKTSFRGKQ